MSLPPQFAGEPAGVGARLAAFTIDVVIVVVLAVLVGLLTGSAAFGGLMALEAILALWILQARGGVSPGKALLGLRVSRAEEPASPGAGPAFVRGWVVAAGALVFAAGAWVIEASGAWDRSGQRRSWADRAAQTRVVAVRRTARDRGRGGSPAALRAPEPTVIARPWTPGAAAPPRGRTAAPPAPTAPVPPAPPLAPVWGAPTPAPTRADAPVEFVHTDQPSIRPTGPVPVEQAVEAWEPPAPEITGELLLIFDTGQREQLPLPVAVILGRNPTAVEASDATIVVRDPDASVSKDHLRLEYDRTGVWITDLGSTNGTELLDDDGTVRPVVAGRRLLVDDDVRVRVGNRVFTVSRLIGDRP